MSKLIREKIDIAIPDFITLANALLGVLAIMYILDSNCNPGVFLILICIILDYLDGRVARLLGKKRGLGRYLDSLADSISFCVAPAILLYKSFYSLERGSAFYDLENALVIIAIVFVVGFGILRLARFAYEKEDNLRFFIGLPAPALAFFIMVLYNLFPIPAIILPICVVSFFMISKLKYPKIEGFLYICLSLIALLFTFLSFVYQLLGSVALAIIIVYIFIAPLYAIKKQISF